MAASAAGVSDGGVAGTTTTRGSVRDAATDFATGSGDALAGGLLRNFRGGPSLKALWLKRDPAPSAQALDRLRARSIRHA